MNFFLQTCELCILTVILKLFFSHHDSCCWRRCHWKWHNWAGWTGSSQLSCSRGGTDAENLHSRWTSPAVGLKEDHCTQLCKLWVASTMWHLQPVWSVHRAARQLRTGSSETASNWSWWECNIHRGNGLRHHHRTGCKQHIFPKQHIWRHHSGNINTNVNPNR